MKIYVGHASSIAFRKTLYEPLRNSSLDETHEIFLPHEDSEELFNSRTFFDGECDLFIADVSEPSTGLGIELGWADEKDVDILCICREDSEPSGSIQAVTGEVVKYEEGELVESLKEVI